jgi:hypothetical protein
MRKIFDILINDKPYPVYSIEGKTHNLGKNNGCPDDWWLLYDEDINESKFLDEMSENSNLIPYIDKGVHRICWEINYRQSNRIKYKWDDYDIRDSGVCTLKANGKEVYKFHSSDLMFAMARVQTLVGELISHPYNFFKPEEDDGRKIFFCGLPAFVYRGWQVGEIKIVPDYSKISKEMWWERYEFYNSNHEDKNYEEFEDELEKDEYDADYELFEEHTNEYYRSDSINWGDALSDGKIYWFRK